MQNNTTIDTYIVECEWDINNTGRTFLSSEAAMEWVREVWSSDELGPISEAFAQGTLEIVHSSKAPKILSKEATQLTPVVLYGLCTLDEHGSSHLNMYTNVEDAMIDADGDEEPFVIETFEGSNLHIEAEANACYSE